MFTVLGALTSMLKTSTQQRRENLALRQQLMVLGRSAPKLMVLRRADRIFWVWLRRVWSYWASALMIVKAETVVAWHRKGFLLFWAWKIRRGKPGRLSVPRKVRDLIRFIEAQRTAAMLAECTKERLSSKERFKLMSQGIVEHAPT
jgi:hypothetical protein